MWRKLLATPEDGLLTFLRLSLFVVFFPHGAQKALGWFGGAGYLPTMAYFTANDIPSLLAILAITAEFAGSVALLFGLLSRIAAFGIACVMVVAITTTHWRNGFFMNWTGLQTGEGFEFHLLALTILLSIMVRGGGAWSVDRALWLSTTDRNWPDISIRESA
ncbi:MAG TPA: DoxX family protein [Bdellovibrionota bacterium]|jgi:putative oxidoreductase